MNDESIPPDVKSVSPFATWVVVAVVVGLLVAWIVFLRPKMSLDQATKNPAVGQPLPVLELQPLTGTTEGISLGDVKGKVTLINFWGPWCPYCVTEFPSLVELWDKNRGNPEFAFISVSSTDGTMREEVQEAREKTRQFLARHDATFPTYIDLGGKNRQLLISLTGSEGFGYPTTVLLDRAGIIRAVWMGGDPGFDRQMEHMVSMLLEEKPK